MAHRAQAQGCRHRVLNKDRPGTHSEQCLCPDDAQGRSHLAGAADWFLGKETGLLRKHATENILRWFLKLSFSLSQKLHF